MEERHRFGNASAAVERQYDRKCVGGHSHYQLWGKTMNELGEWIYRTSLAIHYPDGWADAYAEGATEWAVAEMKYRNQRDEGLPNYVKKTTLRRPETGPEPEYLNIPKNADFSQDDRFVPVDAMQGITVLSEENLTGEINS